ncbi:histidine kinase [Micromonospora sp. NPDC049559]|uniref:sensor histidine kinase n=1 Tax=Micromonospora sp. NPDC049559 TaxID=3155923 RepID=UPI00342B6492
MERRTGMVGLTLRDLWRLLVGPDYPPAAVTPPAWWRRWRGFLVPALLLGLFGLAVAAAQYLHDTRHLPQGPAFLLGLGSVLPAALVPRRPLLAWRIAYPLLFLGAIDRSAQEAFPWNPVQIVGYLFLLLVLALRVDTPITAWVGLLSLIPPYLIGGNLPNAYGITVLVTVLLVLGDQVRRRRQTQRALAEQAERSELEQARRAVLEERTRIAREMHDVVAHHMSMIAVQAETAPYRLDALPEPARAEFTAIAGSARVALTDMRRLLGVLRSESAAAERAPQPGLADVPALVESARRAGMTVALEHEPTPSTGDMVEPPEAVGLAAYRIVQEALANAARHAPGQPVRVTLRPGPAELAIRVENGGGPPAGGAAMPGEPTGAGHGLIGMRERARLLGGTFSAGADGEGFVVTACLPYRDPGGGDRRGPGDEDRRGPEDGDK